MARAVFPHEIIDPDFQWLLNTYCETHPNTIRVENSCLPVVIVTGAPHPSPALDAMPSEEVLALPPGELDETDSSSPKK